MKSPLFVRERVLLVKGVVNCFEVFFYTTNILALDVVKKQILL